MNYSTFINFKKEILGIILILFLIFIFLPLKIIPAEDAAILFQYSQNLADTGEIVYNIGDKHSEGATDFLWMVILSFFYKIGFNTFLISNILSMSALIGTAVLLYKISNIDNIKIFFAICLLLIFLPTTPSAIQGFSTLFFGFFIILTIFLFLNNEYNKMYFFGFLLCLIRPDGVVFITPLIISSIIKTYNKDKLNFLYTVRNFIFLFFFPGIIYFFWRLNYFGELFPLPFYVKSNFDKFLYIFDFGSLKTNISMGILLMLPSIALISITIKDNPEIKNKIIFLYFLIFIIPLFFYSSMSLSQNINNRFQYPLILNTLLIFFLILNYIKNKKLLIFTFSIQVVVISILSFKSFLSLFYLPAEHIMYLAKDLNQIKNKGNLLVTEAGRLPFYSKWPTDDAWGLNTSKFAKKLIQPYDIREKTYDLIVVHALNEDYSSLEKLNDLKAATKRSWTNMTNNIFLGINLNEYSLYFVPYKDFNLLPEFMFEIRKFKRSLFNQKLSRDYIRYDAYFLRNNFKEFKKIEKILLKYNALTFDEYNKLYPNK